MEFSGRVVHGDAYGRTIGYPTINVAIETELAVETKLGVYAGRVQIGDASESHQAAIVLSNPKASGKLKVEAHLLNFSGDLYGQVVNLQCLQFVRDYKEFASESELVAAIESDIKKIRDVLG